MNELFADIPTDTITARYSPEHETWIALLKLNRPARPDDFESLARYCCNTPLAPKRGAISPLGPNGLMYLEPFDPWPLYSLGRTD